MRRPKLLDLFCCAGGAGEGYRRAGFEVVGVDISPQPHYPFEFHQADAMQVLGHLVRHWSAPDDGECPESRMVSGVHSADYEDSGTCSWCGAAAPGTWAFGYEFDAIHASPPCQDHIRGGMRGNHGTGWLLGATRELLEQTGVPWVIENVPGAPMRADYRLCGCMFGLPGLRRPRWFETSWHGFDLQPPCHHIGRAVTVAGHGAQGSWEYVNGVAPTQDHRRAAMGIDWMNRGELAQAIPPAFAEYVGTRLLEHIAAEVAA